MPCCIAIIDYAQCRHSTLYKLGCTAGCDELCAPAKQEMLLRTRFRWHCEECHELRYAADADARIERRDEEARRIMADADEDPTGGDGQRDGTEDARASQAMRMAALRDHEEFEEQLFEQRRVAQVEEIQHAEDWTSQYGRAVFAVRYGSRARRRRPWRRQDEEQGSDDGGCSGLAEDTSPAGDDCDEGKHSAKQGPERMGCRCHDNGGDGGDDDDVAAEQQAARRHAERLRALQQGDLVVLQDALRSSKELREQGPGQRCGLASPAANPWPATVQEHAW